MKIYTKTGDKGETSLIGEKRYKKSEDVFELLGTLDELNACLGVCVVETCEEVRKELIEVQKDLLHIGGILAGSKIAEESKERIKSRTVTFEKTIDDFTEKMCSLTHFILPGGTMQSANLHFARAFSRGVERNAVKNQVLPEILSYLNRLSDLLFTMARYENYKRNVPDVVWSSQE